jgi:N-acetylglucosamine-6-phosphate deacetylase
VRVSLGHSNATTPETLAGIAAGATSATHTFNAMRALDHREPGILGTVLDDDRLYAELICDGIHVAPELVRLWLKAKGFDRAILVTDSMSATGMPDGTYTLGTFEVTVANGHCLSNGNLAGSVLTMDRALANLRLFTGTPLEQAVPLTSANPAALLGLDSPLQIGVPANFNVFDAASNLQSTILGGELIAI